MNKRSNACLQYLTSLFIIVLLSSCINTKIYIVRHAEKQSNPVNPHLTEAGQRRAIALCDSMLQKNIKIIYTTDSNRTRETANPTATRLQLPLSLYANDTLAKFVTAVKKISRKNILIVGHSNTVIQMLDLFGVSHSMPSINDNDFDNLFIINRKKRNGNFIYTLRETTYGQTSP